MKTGEEKITLEQEEAKKSVLNMVKPIFGNGCQMILEERWEEIFKHGWNLEDDHDYVNEELLKCALFCIDQKRFEFPWGWIESYRTKILNKSRVDQLKVAGALIAAEIDRLQNIK